MNKYTYKLTIETSKYMSITVS